MTRLLPLLLAGCFVPGEPPPEDADGDGVHALGDCDDADPNVRPGGREPCDGIDNDCDGTEDGCEPYGVPHEGAVASPGFGQLGTMGTGDLDGDGFLDLAFTAPDQLSGAVILYGPFPESGAIDWAAHGATASHSGDLALTVADADGDGQDDLLVGGGQGAAVYLGPLPGPGMPHESWTELWVQYGDGQVAVAPDTDGNGVPEVLVAREDGLEVSVFELPSTTPVATLARNVNFMDLVAMIPVPDTDGDGFDEMLFVNEGPFSGLISLVTWPLVDGGNYTDEADLSLSGALAWGAEPYARAVAVGDAQGDGIPDVLTGAVPVDEHGVIPGVRVVPLDWRGSVALPYEPGFGLPTAFSGAMPSMISQGEDYDGDGVGDILAVRGEVVNSVGGQSVWGTALLYPALDARYADPTGVPRWLDATDGVRWELVPDLTGDGIGDLVEISDTVTIYSGAAL